LGENGGIPFLACFVPFLFSRPVPRAFFCGLRGVQLFSQHETLGFSVPARSVVRRIFFFFFFGCGRLFLFFLLAVLLSMWASASPLVKDCFLRVIISPSLLFVWWFVLLSPPPPARCLQEVGLGRLRSFFFQVRLFLFCKYLLGFASLRPRCSWRRFGPSSPLKRLGS